MVGKLYDSIRSSKKGSSFFVGDMDTPSSKPLHPFTAGYSKIISLLLVGNIHFLRQIDGPHVVANGNSKYVLAATRKTKLYNNGFLE